MHISDLKKVVGEVKTGEVAKIQFFGHITNEMTKEFNREFEYLESYIKPSRIDILINSEGGSVLYGMSSFSVVQNSSIPTRCINEGLAASFASVMLVSGSETFLKDYSVTMIHNPFLPEHKGEETPPVVEAFAKQLSIIYQKRFGLSKEKVKAIMDGNDGEDGTYFDAEQAVKAGIVPKENIIITSKQTVSNVKAQLENVSSIHAIQAILSSISEEDTADFKQSTEKPAIQFQENASKEDKTQNQNNTPTMAEKTKDDTTTVGFVEAHLAVQLGIKDYDAVSVSARIGTLMAVEAAYSNLKVELDNEKTISAGKDATVQNLTDNLNSVQAKLNVFLEKEKTEQAASVEILVQNAVDAGKILKESKDKWVEAALGNFALVQDTLASIPAREKISEEIGNDKDNVQAAANGSKTTEQAIAERVQAAVGADFNFKTLD